MLDLLTHEIYMCDKRDLLTTKAVLCCQELTCVTCQKIIQGESILEGFVMILR